MRFLLILASVGAAALNTITSAIEGAVFDREGHYIAYNYSDGTRDLYTYDSSWRMVMFEGRDGTKTIFVYSAKAPVKRLLQSPIAVSMLLTGFRSFSSQPVAGLNARRISSVSHTS